MKWLVAVLVLGFFFILAVSANESYSDGYSHGGYTHRGGYWFDSYGRRYTRAKIYNPVEHYTDYYGVSRSRLQTFYYRYSIVADATPAYAAPALAVPAYAPDWRKRHDDYRVLRADYDAYLISSQLLGTGYLGANPFGYGSRATTFNTAYGHAQPYSFNSTTYLGGIDLNVAIAQSGRLAKGAQEYAAGANSEVNLIIKSATEGNAKAQQALAFAIGLERFMASSSPAATTTSAAVAAAEVTAPSAGIDTGAAASIRSAAVFLREVGIPRCGKCHSGATLKGGFDILRFPGMTEAQQDTVLERINGSSEGKPRMPLKADLATSDAQLPTKEIVRFHKIK